jgi:hypothetical protein
MQFTFQSGGDRKDRDADLNPNSAVHSRFARIRESTDRGAEASTDHEAGLSTGGSGHREGESSKKRDTAHGRHPWGHCHRASIPVSHEAGRSGKK